jgi:hypothetical protein
MSENSTRPHSEKGVGPARRPSTRRIGASGLRNKPKWRSMRLKLAAIWRMSVQSVDCNSQPDERSHAREKGDYLAGPGLHRQCQCTSHSRP